MDERERILRRRLSAQHLDRLYPRWLIREVVGAWRSQKQGASISLSVMPFRHLGPTEIEGIEKEAGRMAGQRELDLATVKLSPPIRP